MRSVYSAFSRNVATWLFCFLFFLREEGRFPEFGTDNRHVTILPMCLYYGSNPSHIRRTVHIGEDRNLDSGQTAEWIEGYSTLPSGMGSFSMGLPTMAKPEKAASLYGTEVGLVFERTRT
jgi:hypothetical protein